VPLARGSDAVQETGLRVAAIALVALLAALVLGWSWLLPASLLVLGGLYAAQLGVDDATLDAVAPVFAAGLFVTAELGYWSLEERERVQAEAGEDLRRAGFVAAFGLGALIVGSGLLALVDAVRAGGLVVDVLGAAAAAAAVLAIVLFSRREA
jgi:hypothetical protein